MFSANIFIKCLRAFYNRECIMKRLGAFYNRECIIKYPEDILYLKLFLKLLD